MKNASDIRPSQLVSLLDLATSSYLLDGAVYLSKKVGGYR